jgi:hypothetical protein
MKTSSAKAKGRSLAKKVAEWLRVLGDLGPLDVQPTSSGVTGADVYLSEAGVAKWPLAIECKKHAAFAVYTHYDQAAAYAGKFTPVVVIEANRRKPLVVVDAELFFNVYRNSQIWLGK